MCWLYNQFRNIQRSRVTYWKLRLFIVVKYNIIDTNNSLLVTWAPKSFIELKTAYVHPKNE